MDIVAILDFSNQRLNGFTGKGFNSLAVLSSEVDTSAVGGVPVDQIVLISGCQNFSQKSDLLVDGVCGIGLNGVHIILYSADGDALDGLVFEKCTLLPEPSALGYVGVGSQMPLIPRIEGFRICRERVLFLCGRIHFNGCRRRIIRKIIIDSAAANYLLQPSKEALFFAASADLPVGGLTAAVLAHRKPYSLVRHLWRVPCIVCAVVKVLEKGYRRSGKAVK